MEDISRELEKEITKLKPSPYKKTTKKRILAVDDFGEVKSAGHLKILAYIFGVTSLISLFAACGLYYLFSNQSFENKFLKSELSGLVEAVDRLVTQKEVLMARLVISGKEPWVEGITANAKAARSVTAAKEKKAGIKEKPDTRRVNTARKKRSPSTADTKTKEPASLPIVLAEKNPDKETEPVSESNEPVQQIVAIEKFTVTRDGADGDLLVRFDIRNISDKPGGVSGRIFTILKPENRSRKDWLVVPAVQLNEGIPSQHSKGQYFSIAHFKPVKFRIENQAGPDFFKKAAIYIFNENGDLVFESLIDITEEEPN